MLSAQGQRAADKINRRSLDTLTTQSATFAWAGTINVCKVHVKDVKGRSEGVEIRVEYEESVWWLID